MCRRLGGSGVQGSVSAIGYIRIMEKKLETTRVYWGYVGFRV